MYEYDEKKNKIFTVKGKFNDHFLHKMSTEKQKPASEMVLSSVTVEIRSSPDFIL